MIGIDNISIMYNDITLYNTLGEIFMKDSKCTIIILSIISCLLTGCGGTSQPDLSVTEEKEVVSTQLPEGFGAVSDESGEMVYYALTEKAVADEQHSLLEVAGGRQYIVESPVLCEGKIYREVITFKEAGVYGDCYYQVYDKEKESWSFVPSNGLELFVEGKELYSFGDLHMSRGTLYADAYVMEEKQHYLVSFADDNIDKVYGKREAEYVLTEGKDGCFLGYEPGGEEVVFYSNALVEQNRFSVQGKIYGLVQDGEGIDYWYGSMEEEKLTIQEAISGEVLLESFEGIISSECKVRCSSKGELFIADKQGIWKLEEEPALVYNFIENDYIVDSFYDMQADADGGMELLVQLDGVLTLLSLWETDTLPGGDREEVVISFAMEHQAMKKSIARFNRQSKEYHVSMLVPGADEDYQDYMNRIQMELSIGKGPDILGHDMIYDVESYVENGYLECLNGLLDENDYLQAALDGCRIDNDLYGIPYDCQFTFATYRKAAIGEQDTVTVGELMQVVEASGAKVLEGGATGLDIVKYYGLYDTTNKAYIDWECGESHLTEPAFLEFLEFAKKYSDARANDQYKGKMAQDKEAFAIRVDLEELQWLNYMETCLEGEEALFGYPCEEGNGIYIKSRELYVNQGASCKAGAKEFLKYLLSEEEQMKYISFDVMEELTAGGSLMGYRAQFPIHLEAFEAVIMQGRNVDREEFYQNYGVSYENHSLTDSQVEDFLFLIEHAKPVSSEASVIFGFVTEELTPYFDGTVSAKVAAEKLDNRVQLYLDERK